MVPKYHSQSRTSSPQLRHVQFNLVRKKGADFSQAPIKWDPVDVTPQLKDGRTVIPDKAIDSVKTNYIALKGPLAVSFSTFVLEKMRLIT